MAYVPVSRASALPNGAPAAAQSSRWSALAAHAAHRADEVAHLLVRDGEVVVRTWAETARSVELAAAGLVRSGLRVDQVVLTLLPAGHPFPELDVALRTIGAVVVHVAADATAADLRRDLAGVDVRLVVVEDPRDLARLPEDVSFPSAELFALDGGRGWDRLLQLGAERLVMDPDAVARVDRSVDPDGAVPRLLAPGRPLGRLAPEVPLPGGLLRPTDLVLVAAGSTDEVTLRVHEEHLAAGSAVCVLPDGGPLLEAVDRTRPTVLALSPRATQAVVDALDVPPSPRPRRAALRRVPVPEAPPVLGGRVRLLLTPSVDARSRAVLGAAGIEVLALGGPHLAPADLPVPPVEVAGVVADLPRRSRTDPGRDFQLDVDRAAPRSAEPEPSAFVLPSLPLFGGESFLDKLLLARAREAGQ